MVSNSLFTLGLILLIVSVWINKNYSSTLSKLNTKRIKEYNPIISMIRVFQLWGLYWLICGIVLKVLGESQLDGDFGTLIFSLIFLIPLVMITIVGLKKKDKNN